MKTKRKREKKKKKKSLKGGEMGGITCSVKYISQVKIGHFKINTSYMGIW